jgi:hypothetical protein
MTDGIPTQEPGDLELGTGANLGGSSSTSNQDVDTDELKYLKILEDSRIVESLLTQELTVDGTVRTIAYHGAGLDEEDMMYLGSEMGAVTPFFPAIRRGHTISNTWRTEASMSVGRGILSCKVSFNNPTLVAVNLGRWRDSVTRALFRQDSSRKRGVVDYSGGKEKEEKKRFVLNTLSFITDVSGEPTLFSFQYGGLAKWGNNKALEKYLSLKVSKRGSGFDDRFQEVVTVEDVPEEVMSIREFENILKKSKNKMSVVLAEQQAGTRRSFGR